MQAGPKGSVVRVLLVDDHQLFRSGLRLLLSGLYAELVFEEAGSCEQAILLEDKDKVDIILLDFNLPGAQKFEALSLIKSHFAGSVVVLSGEDDPRLIRETISQGAAGFIPKSSSPEVMVAALQLVMANGIYLPPNVLAGYAEPGEAEEETSQKQEILQQLSERQLDVLIKVAQGKSNKVVAHELHIAEGTVKAHLSACYRALNVDNRTEAVYITASLGLVPEFEAKT